MPAAPTQTAPESLPVPTSTLDTSEPTTPPSDPFTANFLQIPAPACTAPTPQQTEGPYYKSGSPERTVLRETGMPGEQLLVAGYVLDQNCQPIQNAWVDFWQADANGAYDNTGYVLRGHQFTDEQGRYYLETVLPGEYPGRPPHIHLKIQPPNGTVITSQIYFPNSSSNASDGIFDPALLVTLDEREGLYVAYFNFVVGN
jgi:protocatechuate 3,4-dioxygenase beta subunit